MKKSIVLIIVVVYLAAIIIIGFFGMKISAYNEQIYATDIVLINEDIRKSTGPNGIGNYVEVNYKDNSDENVYFLTWRVLPEDCTNKKIHFIIAEKNQNLVEIDEKRGLIRYKGKGVVRIDMESETSPKATQTLTLIIL